MEPMFILAIVLVSIVLLKIIFKLDIKKSRNADGK